MTKTKKKTLSGKALTDLKGFKAKEKSALKKVPEKLKKNTLFISKSFYSINLSKGRR